jgi:hypothetical protein
MGGEAAPAARRMAGLMDVEVNFELELLKPPWRPCLGHHSTSAMPLPSLGHYRYLCRRTPPHGGPGPAPRAGGARRHTVAATAHSADPAANECVRALPHARQRAARGARLPVSRERATSTRPPDSPPLPTAPDPLTPSGRQPTAQLLPGLGACPRLWLCAPSNPPLTLKCHPCFPRSAPCPCRGTAAGCTAAATTAPSVCGTRPVWRRACARAC